MILENSNGLMGQFNLFSFLNLQVRLDAATVVGLLAFFINYKFEDVLSSPYVFLTSHEIALGI